MSDFEASKVWHVGILFLFCMCSEGKEKRFLLSSSCPSVASPHFTKLHQGKSELLLTLSHVIKISVHKD